MLQEYLQLPQKVKSKIVEGFCTSLMKGAGIRVYEYSTLQNNNDCKLQLEVLFLVMQGYRGVYKRVRRIRLLFGITLLN